MTDLFPVPQATLDRLDNPAAANLDRDYIHVATFTAYSAGISSNPQQGEITLRLRVPKIHREAAEVADKLEGVVCRFDVWIPRYLVIEDEDEDEDEGTDGDGSA